MSEVAVTPGRFESAIQESLKEGALAEYVVLRKDVANIATYAKRLQQAHDLVLIMAAANDLSLAAENLAETAERMHKQADAALISAMDGSGCSTFASGMLTVSLRRNPGSVDILDPEAVPPECMVQPAPRPDRTKIRDYIKQHPSANWARLVSGGLGLMRRSKS